MHKMQSLSRQSVALLSVLLLIGIIISYRWVDRPVVWFLVSHHSRALLVLKIFANDIVFALGLIVLLFYIISGLMVIFSAKRKQKYSRFHIVTLAVVISAFIKDCLKFVFGRYWPSSFGAAKQSLLATKDYGFHWFHGSEALGSFPSGHTTFIIAFAVAMSACYPKFKWLYWVIAALVIIGQVGMYYHFVSDVLGGTLLGLLTAQACIRMLNKH